ncbi:MAG: cytochrome-c peroxidase, partial [Methyloprofundus sp.]|nr:cytochrome-c peroxidase [Methyloprofundus sp.]
VQAQARFPVTSNEEMKGFDHANYTNQTIRELLAGRLGGYGDEPTALDNNTLAIWLEKFQTALNSPDAAAEDIITEQNVSMMIAEYERSQAFVNTPWKQYVEGNKYALSNNAKKGALLFYSSKADGGADCASCHQGDFFTDESFHNVAMPQIGPGKGDGIDGSKDFGRARETGLEADKFAFRTPSLINVEVTGPWSHAGSYTSLAAVVKHHLNPALAIETYDESQLAQFDIRNMEQMTANTTEALEAASFFAQGEEPVALNDRQVGFIVEFLQALTDPCTQDRECLSPWIATQEAGDSEQLNAYDQEGNLL